MQNIHLEDSSLLGTVLDMLVDEIGIGTAMDEELLDSNEEYQEACSKVDTVESILKELPGAASLVESYIDASIQAENLYDKAVFLKGVKTGFNLYLYLREEKEGQ